MESLNYYTCSDDEYNKILKTKKWVKEVEIEDIQKDLEYLFL